MSIELELPDEDTLIFQWAEDAIAACDAVLALPDIDGSHRKAVDIATNELRQLRASYAVAFPYREPINGA